MSKSATFLAAAIAVSATAAFAGQPAERRFVRDGQTFVYTTQPSSGGTLISGYRMPGNARFSVVVLNGRVTGHSGGRPVSFKTASAAGAASGSIVTASN